MDSDDDLISRNQYRKQQRSNSAMSQTVTSSCANRAQAGRAGNPGISQQPNQVSQEDRLSQLQEGMVFLLNSLQEITGSQLGPRAVKRPAEQKPFDKKPNTKEKCFLCKKLYANKTTLFRHYRAIHEEMNPEKYHGCSLNDTIFNLDSSIRDTECSICGYVAVNQTALSQHNNSTHNNDAPSVNATNKEKINNNAGINVKDKMYKCEDCACYFEEKSKFDEHMKVQHGFEVVCKICNKHFLFKDIDRHVKDSHPDVYNKKDKDEKKEKVIVEKVMVNKKGKRVRVFTCTKCDQKFYDKIEAQKHARAHKKGFKIKVALGNKYKPNENIKDLTSADDNVIFTCETCDVSTGSYDAAVEHSQNHITNKFNNEQLLTQTCPVCVLKFEPLCYKMHMDLHYKNKEIHKESFKYVKYRFQLLLNDDWVNSFDMNDAVIKKKISQSIYANTRKVKMVVVEERKDEGQNLYQCCKCDRFVDPAAVVNHALNFDTCIKVNSSYACDICNRKFNNRLTRDKHAKDHNSGNFKVVLFNNESDKEFNKVLNNPRTSLVMQHIVNNGLNSVAEERSGNNINDHAKVIYKCLCGLCFVRKERADTHTKICPGKDAKKSCPKCNNFFDQEELLVHCFEHHLNETEIFIENFTPDVIEIESDEEPENENNDEEEKDNENNTVKCVPTNLLLDPFNFDNSFLKRVEIVSRQIETTENSSIELVNCVTIKEEKPWCFDPTDYSKICRRPSLRQIEMPSTSSQVILESLLTDDEEEMESPAIPQTNSNNILSPFAELNKNSNTGELFNEVPAKERHTDIARNEHLSTNEQSVASRTNIADKEHYTQSNLFENNTDKNLADAQTNKHNNETNRDQSFLNTNIENHEDSDAEDDLFLPSGKENRDVHYSRLNNDDTSREKQNKEAEQIREPDMTSKERNANEELENVNLEDLPTNETEMQGNRVGSETENNISVYLDVIERQKVADKENDSILTERDKIQSNHDDDAIDYEEINLTNTVIENAVAKDTGETLGYQEINPRSTVSKNYYNKDMLALNKTAKNISDVITTIKKEVGGYMNMQIKAELVGESRDDEIDCDTDDLVEVKTEPNDRLGTDDKDSGVINNIDNVIDNNCCIC